MADALEWTTDGLTHTAGTGAPIVLAHGASSSVQQTFTGVMRLLGSRRSFLGTDYPGSGGRPAADGPLSVESLADELVSNAVAAGHERFPIVAMSMGSAVALTAAASHPEQVSGVVLTVGHALADLQIKDGVAAVSALWDAGRHTEAARLILALVSSSATLAAMTSEQHDAIVPQLEGSLSDGAIDQLRLAAGLDIRDIVSAVQVPVMVIAAGRDRLVNPASTRALADLVPGAELLEYPDAGHLFTPAEEVHWAADAEDFLNRHGL